MEQTHEGHCKNCKRNLLGKYCHHCGQKKITSEEKKLKHFIEELFSSLFVADGKALITFKYLFTKPGALSKSYIGGATKQYLSPLQLFFFANLIYFLFPLLNTFSTGLDTQLKSQIYSDYVEETVQDYLSEKGVSYEYYQDKFEQKSNNLGKVLLIILVICQALFFRLYFIKRKELYMVDFLTAASYFISFYILAYLIIIPFLINGVDKIFEFNSWSFFNDGTLTIVYSLCNVVYLTFFFRRAFSITIINSVIGAILSVFFLLPTFILYRFILFVITHVLIT